jgi:hypothetical protein
MPFNKSRLGLWGQVYIALSPELCLLLLYLLLGCLFNLNFFLIPLELRVFINLTKFVPAIVTMDKLSSTFQLPEASFRQDEFTSWPRAMVLNGLDCQAVQKSGQCDHGSRAHI